MQRPSLVVVVRHGRHGIGSDSRYGAAAVGATFGALTHVGVLQLATGILPDYAMALIRRG